MKPLAEMGKFKTVVVDPPWEMPEIGYARRPLSDSLVRTHRERLSYATMPIETLCSLPVNNILDDDAFVFCWAVSRFLSDAFVVLHSWNVQYWFTMTWVKSDGMQLPNTPRFNSEWIVVGRKGNPRWSTTRSFRIANCWPRRGHSEKPEELYDLLRRVTPGPRLDVFGRRRIPGFVSWGDQAPEGPAPEGHYQDVMNV